MIPVNSFFVKMKDKVPVYHGMKVCKGLRFQVLMLAGTKVTVFFDVVPYSLVEVYCCFRGAFCLHRQGTGRTFFLHPLHIVRKRNALLGNYMHVDLSTFYIQKLLTDLN
jgi:hypothetical protein